MLALAYRLPVVSTPTGNTPDLVTEGFNGHLTSDPERMAEAIKDLSDEDIVRMGDNSLEMAKGFSWSDYVGTIGKMYHYVMKR